MIYSAQSAISYVNDLKRYLETSDEEINKLKKELSEEKEKGLTLAGNIQGKVSPVKRLKFSYDATRWPDPNTAELSLDSDYNRLSVMHTDNVASIDSNVILGGTLIAIFEKLGLSKREPYRKSKRSRYDSYREASWLTGIKASVPVDDGWAIIQSEYKTKKRYIEEWKIRHKKEQDEKLARVAINTRSLHKEAVLEKFRKKYALTNSCCEYDVLQTVLAKNKYLRLAHYAMKNRENWEDGTQKVQVGLVGFDIITQEDRKILLEMKKLIQEWVGDGRCFRDCEYNYDFLFEKAEKADKDLVNDYTELSSAFDTI